MRRKQLNLFLSVKLSGLFHTQITVSTLSLRRLFSRYILRKFIPRTVVKARFALRRFPKRKFYELRRLFISFFLGQRFRRYNLFMRILASLLFNYKRRQGRLLGLYKQLFKKFFSLPGLLGISFMLRGKFNRRPRAREFEFFTTRQPPFQDLNVRVMYAGKRLITDFGVYTFKMWFYKY